MMTMMIDDELMSDIRAPFSLPTNFTLSGFVNVERKHSSIPHNRNMMHLDLLRF